MSGTDDVKGDRKVVCDEVGRIVAVGVDTTDKPGSQEIRIRARSLQPIFGRR